MTCCKILHDLKLIFIIALFRTNADGCLRVTLRSCVISKQSKVKQTKTQKFCCGSSTSCSLCLNLCLFHSLPIALWNLPPSPWIRAWRSLDFQQGTAWVSCFRCSWNITKLYFAHYVDTLVFLTELVLILLLVLLCSIFTCLHGVHYESFHVSRIRNTWVLTTELKT